MKKAKKIIGRREKVDFPALDLFGIDAKVDTGAYTSAIHCHNVRVFTEGDQKRVLFNLLDPSHPNYNEREYDLPVVNEKRIKNSFGQVQKRIIIKTTMTIFKKTYTIELSLADRSRLEYPVLLGRKAINKRFMVDVSLVNIGSSTSTQTGESS